MITVNEILSDAVAVLDSNCYEGSVAHKKVLSVYNNYKPLPRSYKVKVTDHWCATFISSLFINKGESALIGGPECSCGKLIENMIKKGIWIEDGSSVPKAGDIVFYDWDAKDGWPEHVGIVEEVFGKTIVVIEGNYNNTVGRRTVNVGWKMIRGYGRPAYAQSTIKVPTKTVQAIAKEVIQGKWGTGRDRKAALNAAGYDPELVQEWVNTLLVTKKTPAEVAKEVINGEWGNGVQRTNALIRAGYNAKEVQREVNKLCSQ